MDISYQKSILMNILASFSLKNSLLKTILVVIGLLAGIKVYVLGIFILVVIDVVTGIMAASHRGEKFSSKILRKGLLDKFVLYLMMVIGTFTLEVIFKTVIHYDPWFMVFLCTFLIACYECISIFENVLVIFPEMKFIKSLISLTNKLSDKAIEEADKT